MIQRRGFLAGILAAGVAPFAVKAGVLMPVAKSERLVTGIAQRLAMMVP